jgi:hypothetical protein
MKPIEERARPWRLFKFPPGWRLATEQTTASGPLWVWYKEHRTVFISEEQHPYGTWLHGSIATRGHIRYEDLLYLRRHWFGQDWPAVQFFPTQEGYVNLHENCLHLWACLSHDPAWVEEQIEHGRVLQ